MSRYTTTLTVTDHAMNSDAAALHHAVMALFPRNLPSPSARQASGILYRLDGNTLTVQSIPPPARPITGATIIDTHPTDIEPPTGTLTIT